MNFEDKIKLHYPLPIAQLYAAVQLEIDPRLQVKKLVELFEGTVRYLALIGLAGYIHHQLADPQVESLRSGLVRPSLGHWVGLLRATSYLLTTSQFQLLGDNLNQNRNSDAVGEATRQLTEMLDLPPKAKRLKIDHFLSIMVEFRNKKDGHGFLPRWQARKIVPSLEAALLLWLEELTILEQQKLVYLAQVEWQEPQFLYRGLNLNTGNYLTSFTSSGAKGLAGSRIYLHHPTSNEFLPLYPFFIFDDDIRLLYVYNELSNQDKLLLRCPYETLGGETPRYLDVNKTMVVGLGLSVPVTDEAIAEETTPATSELPQTPTTTIEEKMQREPEVVPPVSGPDLFTEPSLQPPAALPEVISPSPPLLTFDDVTEQLERRIRQVCRPQARYPVLWIVGPPCSGKTAIAKAVCLRAAWTYIDFTLDPGCLDSLAGQEETYQPETFLKYLHNLCQSTTAEVIILDEIEPLLGWWSWDEQEAFFQKIARATRLRCGVALVTRLRNTSQFEKITPSKNHVFEIPIGVEP